MDAEAQPAHDHLMASPHHRDNILDARFTVVGLGATYRDGSWWITEDFLQPAAAPRGHEVARSLPAAPPPAKAAPPSTVTARTPAPPAGVAAPSAPAAQVEAASEGEHWLATAPGLTSGDAPTSQLSLPRRAGRLPAPATGAAFAAACWVAGLLVRRRAVTLATS
jgi:hypothetical protein